MLVRSFLVRLVDACRRNAPWVVLMTLLFAGLCGYYAATHLSIDTDTNKLISEDVPWRQRERAFDRAFPQNTELLAIVIDVLILLAGRVITPWARVKASS